VINGVKAAHQEGRGTSAQAVVDVAIDLVAGLVMIVEAAGLVMIVEAAGLVMVGVLNVVPPMVVVTALSAGIAMTARLVTRVGQMARSVGIAMTASRLGVQSVAPMVVATALSAGTAMTASLAIVRGVASRWTKRGLPSRRPTTVRRFLNTSQAKNSTAMLPVN
jgi:hypothetical protein